LFSTITPFELLQVVVTKLSKAGSSSVWSLYEDGKRKAAATGSTIVDRVSNLNPGFAGGGEVKMVLVGKLPERFRR